MHHSLFLYAYTYDDDDAEPHRQRTLVRDGSYSAYNPYISYHITCGLRHSALMIDCGGARCAERNP